MKEILFSSSVRKTVFHEVGHFLTYKTQKGIDGFNYLRIAESDGVHFVREELPIPEIAKKEYNGITPFSDDDGFVAGAIEIKEEELSTFEDGVVLCGGKVAEMIIKNKTIFFLRGKDKELFDALELSTSNKRKCRKEAEQILRKNKDLLYFISERILRLYRKRPKIQEGKYFEYYSSYTIDREGMKSILQEYENTKTKETIKIS